MMPSLSKDEEINILASEAEWAWPRALDDIFRPCGVNLLVAGDDGEFMNIIEERRIHTTIVDVDCEGLNGFGTVRLIRVDYPVLPCIVLAREVDERMLGKALELDVFGVLGKPVDMILLRRVLNRLFVKKYDSRIFQGEAEQAEAESEKQ